MNRATVGSMLVVAGMAAILCAFGCRAIIARAEQWNLIDRPSGRKNHARPTPTDGGLAFWPAMIALPTIVVLSLALLSEAGRLPAPLQESIAPLHRGNTGAGFAYPRIVLVAMTATGLMLLGLWDDLCGIAWPLRLTAETIAAVATVIAGFSLRHLPGLSHEAHSIGLLLDGLSVLWIVGLVNSLNMLDNMDGLAAGVASIIALALIGCGWAWSPAVAPWWTFFASALVGALAAFLAFNKQPAQLFMGDAGSYPVGYLLAVFGLIMPAHGSVDTQRTVLGLLCLFAVPLYDTASVVVLRLWAGTSPFQPDHRHLSHRLAALGLGSGRAVAAIALLAAVGAAPAVMMPFAPSWGTTAAIAVLSCFAVALPLGEIAMHRARRDRRSM